ncbi:MAG TPA: CCA tRNA nucleotidyltransferase [Mycobacteriales bacterium]|nr:CCA tRNA nucleotidyltransferase [Mycobacteriales bacterium]
MRELLRVDPVTRDVAERFVASGHDLYLVGGSVRDALLGRLGADLDFATGARPEQVLDIVRGLGPTWTTGIAFGTVGVQVGDGDEAHRLEITTYRSDTYDRHSRKPEVDYGTSIEGDLGRRDFSVNAMAIQLPLDAARPVVDPYDGLTDLGRRVLRTPITPERSFDDDPLRMLRAARFAAQLGFAVDAAALDAITAMRDRLEIVSAERVRDELTKLILAPKPRAGLEVLVHTGLGDHCLPEVARLAETVDEHGRHKDVYAHTLTVLEQAIALEDAGPDLVLRLAALLHDIGKPDTKKVKDGKVSFHHHEVVGAKLARARLSALRFAKDVVDDVTELVKLHLRFHGYAEDEWTDAAVRRYVRDAGPLLSRLHKLTRSDCTTRNAAKARALATAYDALEQRIETLAQEEELDKLRPALDGNEIMAELGVGPGPVVGRAWKHLLEQRIEQGPMSREEAIAELRRWAESEGPDSEGPDSEGPDSEGLGRE